jgi:Protein of unknown function (DUF2795)
VRIERSSDRHGPRIDEDLDRLTQSVTRGAPVESRAEEEREQEGPADDEPVAEAVIHGPGEDFELRSEIARHLEPSGFPASRDQLIRIARREQAPTGVLQWLERLPHGHYPTIESVWEALGGYRERR